LKCERVGWISAYELLKLFAGLGGAATGRSDSPELRVLGPQITLNNFSPQRELQEGNIASRKPAPALRGLCIVLGPQ
jgi:hypothetical protein